MDTSRDIELIKESTYRNSSKNHPLLNKLPPQIQYCAKAMQAPVDEIPCFSTNLYRIYPQIGRTRVLATPQTFNGFHGKKKIVEVEYRDK